MKQNTVLVTGGMGFIGRRLIARLTQLPDVSSVVALDNFHPQVHGETPDKFITGAVVEEGSVSDRAFFEEVLDRHDPDMIFHLAAETGTGQSYHEISRYCDTNISGTAYLIEGLRKLPEKPRRLVLASSRAVYGEGAYKSSSGEIFTPKPRSSETMAKGVFGLYDSGGKVATPVATPEGITLRPSSIYASTKLMQEYICVQGLDNTSIQPVILRFQNVYGPGQSSRNPYTGVLSIFGQQILDGKLLNIYEDGEIVRDFVYVDDIVEALILAAVSGNVDDEPINVGSGVSTTIRYAAECLLSELGVNKEKLRISGDFRPGDIRFALADNSRAQTLLGYEPKVSLEAGIAALARHIKSERSRR
ncbi:NAD-dependent epimerase/dehydratase family protein [Rhizobium phaseoli]|uniref:NAD-dependent epimerase/dehydratase family protein n=1 Tax=Rhizobium phaseoli TaxID=396 RepID=UPI0007F110F9|nr:NAD-dependent epimerase/dehydratase family protein [Rhizobium phaseoli]ANL26676.1 NAD-dependent epimerase/dehydratase family protein [Rhizobium phaseoli]